MRATLLFALLLLQACASKPPAPNPSPCASIPSCGEEAIKGKKKVAGLGTDKTVQLMVQSPMLIGGKPADAGEWPASLYARAGGSACSSTLVGERVLFMAAHCMPNGGTVSFTAHSNAYKATCQHHPEYKNNDTADWALCIVDRPVIGVPFEVMGVEMLVAMNSELLLSGYGCLKAGGGGGNDGIFRTGNAVVKGLPSGKVYDIVTKGGAALCFGDSGGAAYAVSGSSRYIVGVNSRGDISTMSYLPAINSPAFVSWAKSWALISNNVRICGMHEDAMGCRTGNPSPQVDGKFEISAPAACIRGMVTPNYLDKKDEIVENLRKSLEQF